MKNSAVQYLLGTAKKFPNNIAVSDGFCSMTFTQLVGTAAKVSAALIEKGVFNKPVLVYLPKSCHSIASFAGILFSGNFYVPLDIKSPDSRLKSILAAFPQAMFISDSHYFEELFDLGIDTERIIDVYLGTEIVGLPSAELSQAVMKAADIIDTDPVYIMHTSGSTGVPKGVVIPHRGVIDYIDWALETIGVEPSDVIGNQAPLYFDNSTLDIFLSWATGCRLHLIPEACFAFPTMLLDELERENVTFVFFVPSVLVSISKLGLLDPSRLPELKKIVFAGEVMPTRHLSYWQKNLPGRTFINLYGPTEITVDCTYYFVDRAFGPDESLPIGWPCRNSDVMILDENGFPAKGGSPGELCVRGSSLALGYWNDLEKTAAAFVQNPLNSHYPERIYRTGDMVMRAPSGEILYLGRKDSQIKHLGHRIELGEIEAAAGCLAGVDQCCSVYDHSRQEIVLFFEGDDAIQTKELLRALRTRLPIYMVPRRIERKKSLPLTPNGKIDRVSLSKEFSA